MLRQIWGIISPIITILLIVTMNYFSRAYRKEKETRERLEKENALLKRKLSGLINPGQIS